MYFQIRLYISNITETEKRQVLVFTLKKNFNDFGFWFAMYIRHSDLSCLVDMLCYKAILFVAKANLANPSISYGTEPKGSRSL